MKFVFHTEKLDELMFKNVMNHFMLEAGGIPLMKRMNKWTCIVYPSTMASEDKFFYGKDGVGGVTAPYVIKLYVNDEKENYSSQYNPILLANGKPMTHEGAHAILIEMGEDQHVPLRNDDYGGNKKGTMLPFYTAEVHDRDIEGKVYTLKVKIFVWSRLRSYTKDVRVLDIRDLV